MMFIKSKNHQSANAWRCTESKDSDLTSSATSSHPSIGIGLQEESNSLVSQLRQKDEVISSLCNTMRASEKILLASEEAQSKRISMLELQLEQLVEASSNAERVRLGGAKVAPSFAVVPSSGRDDDHVHALNGLLGQVSSLKELLARILAEKDKLQHENQSLKHIFATENGGKKEDRKRSHSDKKKDRKKSHRKNMDDSLLDVHNECYDMSLSVNDLFNSFVSEPKLDVSTSQGRTSAIHYRLSCGICCNNHSHIKYLGSYTPKSTSSTKKKEELARQLVGHYLQVCMMMRDVDNFSSQSSVHLDEFMGRVDGFASSSFARHLVKHCQDCGGDEEVVNWCVKNVRVEIAKEDN